MRSFIKKNEFSFIVIALLLFCLPHVFKAIEAEVLHENNYIFDLFLSTLGFIVLWPLLVQTKWTSKQLHIISSYFQIIVTLVFIRFMVLGLYGWAIYLLFVSIIPHVLWRLLKKKLITKDDSANTENQIT
jgi:hypothetical protein